MKKNLMKILAAFAIVLGLGFAMNCAKVNAATKIYKKVPTTQNKITQAGNYWITPLWTAGEGYVGMKISATQDGQALYTLGENTDLFFSNGTYLYFVMDNNDGSSILYKLTLSNLQLTKVKKYKTNIKILQVYGNKVYFSYYPGDSTERVVLKYINSSTHKTKTISRNINGETIKVKKCRYIYYKPDTGKNKNKKYRLDCKTGKTKRV